RIYAYALSRDSVERVIRDLRIEARTVRRPEQADLIISLRGRAGDPRLQRLLDLTGLPLHVVKKNTTAQIRRLLQALFNVFAGREDTEVDAAAREAESAARQVLQSGTAIELAPRPASLRKLQHRIAARYRLVAESEGQEPLRHLVIHPT
ncbi:MAG: R3H domain-containing nucleic acid-binding protein, partial [Gammaproteobacteria bacterium]